MTEFVPHRFESHRPLLLAGIRRSHDFGSAPQTIPAQWAEFRAAGALPGRAGGVTYGATCGSSESGFEYMCAVEVASFDGLAAHVGRMRVPAQHYAVFVHEGHVSGLGQCWMQIFQWLAGSTYESAHTPDFERYDETFDIAKGTGRIEVWVGVRARGGGA